MENGSRVSLWHYSSIKPASEAAIPCAKLIQCFHDAELPKEIINMVTGSGSLIGSKW